MQKPTERDIVIRGQLIHYYSVGTEDNKKDTIIFLHGWGSNSTLWFSSTIGLSENGFNLVYIDLPGFGKSQSPKQPLHLEDYAQIVSEFVEKISITKPILIGHSFGGKVAARIASKKMIQLGGLILVDASGLPHTSLITKAKIQIAKTVSPFFRLPILKDLRSGLLRLSGSDDYVAFPELRETFINIIREHIQDELITIDVPTFIVWGTNDTNSYTPVRDAAIFQKKIRNSQMVLIKEASHYVFLDKPKEFIESVSSFLDSIHAHH